MSKKLGRRVNEPDRRQQRGKSKCCSMLYSIRFIYTRQFIQMATLQEVIFFYVKIVNM
jgi:hypothetical protein